MNAPKPRASGAWPTGISVGHVAYQAEWANETEAEWANETELPALNVAGPMRSVKLTGNLPSVSHIYVYIYIRIYIYVYIYTHTYKGLRGQGQ